MITEFNTIHIFGYGEAQIIGENLNFKAAISKFTKLQAVVDDIKSKKPTDVSEGDYHAINLFYSIDVRYMGKQQENSFSTTLAELNETKLNNLIAEFATLKAAEDVAIAAKTSN
jgi:hypothetical protein